MGVLALAPVIAVVLSLIKGRQDTGTLPQEKQNPRTKVGSYQGMVALMLVLAPAALYVASLKITQLASIKNIALWALPVGGTIAILLSNYILEYCDTSTARASWLARWAGVLAIIDISAFIAAVLFGLTSKVEVHKMEIPARHELSGVSYVILAVVFLIIVGGLGWCFYRAVAAAGVFAEPQSPDEIGDNEKQ